MPSCLQSCVVGGFCKPLAPASIDLDTCSRCRPPVPVPGCRQRFEKNDAPLRIESDLQAPSADMPRHRTALEIVWNRLVDAGIVYLDGDRLARSGARALGRGSRTQRSCSAPASASDQKVSLQVDSHEPALHASQQVTQPYSVHSDWLPLHVFGSQVDVLPPEPPAPEPPEP